MQHFQHEHAHCVPNDLMADSNEQLETDTEVTQSYWYESMRPLVCLVFIAPILLIYEGGVLMLGTHATRNGVDVYLRGLLDWIGFSQYFLLPLLISFILLAWHHILRQPWKVRGSTLIGMFFEALTLGFILLLLARVHGALFPSNVSAIVCATEAENGESLLLGKLVGYLGAGIYEELLFRLMLLPAAAAIARGCGASDKTSVVIAVIATSLIFSGAHYQEFTFNSGADKFALDTFFFRATAGVFFSMLFLYRGFGIAVGAHAFYDVIVALHSA